MADPERPRHRMRHDPTVSRSDGASGCSARTSGVHDPGREQIDRRGGEGRDLSDEERETDRGLRGLIGSGTSQVSVTAALRARDAARPTDEEIAEAEQRLVIVRRNWVPPDAPSRAR